MAVEFYDNLSPSPIDEGPGLVELERIYCFDWTQFAETTWQELDRIYRTLPGKVRYKDVAWWFGEDEASPPFLWASVEPSGLQVYGVVNSADWSAWDEKFRSAAGDLPMRMLN